MTLRGLFLPPWRRFLSLRHGPVSTRGTDEMSHLLEEAKRLERAHVVRELHDGIVQSLIGLEMQVDVWRRGAGAPDSPMAGTLGQIQQRLRDQILELRDLMEQLKPTCIDPEYLLEHLDDLVAKFRRETGIAATFVSDVAEVSVAPHVCAEIAHIVQEALVNVRKHSGASTVVVRLGADEHQWRLLIDDDGRGFQLSGRHGPEGDPACRKPATIEERVRSIGGRLAVESRPGRGARLEICFPRQTSPSELGPGPPTPPPTDKTA